MACPKCEKFERHGNSGAISITVEFTTGSIGCLEPVDILRKLTDSVRAELERTESLKAWTIRVKKSRYEPYRAGEPSVELE